MSTYAHLLRGRGSTDVTMSRGDIIIIMNQPKIGNQCFCAVSWCWSLSYYSRDGWISLLSLTPVTL